MRNGYGIRDRRGRLVGTEAAKRKLASIEATAEELAALAEYVKSGGSYYDNPWNIADERGRVLPFVAARRIVWDLFDEKPAE